MENEKEIGGRWSVGLSMWRLLDQKKKKKKIYYKNSSYSHKYSLSCFHGSFNQKKRNFFVCRIWAMVSPFSCECLPSSQIEQACLPVWGHSIPHLYTKTHPTFSFKHQDIYIERETISHFLYYGPSSSSSFGYGFFHVIFVLLLLLFPVILIMNYNCKRQQQQQREKKLCKQQMKSENYSKMNP